MLVLLSDQTSDTTCITGIDLYAKSQTNTEKCFFLTLFFLLYIIGSFSITQLTNNKYVQISKLQSPGHKCLAFFVGHYM